MKILDLLRRNTGPSDDPWQTAKTIDDLCALTVRWLAGELDSTPNYLGPVDVDEAAGTRFQTLEDVCRRRGPYVPVTYTNGRPYTRFGAESWADVKFSWDGCGDEALAALRDAWQVTIYDPVVGPNDLWPVLRAAADR